SGFTMTLLSALFLAPFVVFRRDRLQALRAHRAGLLVRGGLEIAFMVCKLYALQFLQAPDVVAVQRLSLVLSILGGRVFFKEPDFKRRLAGGCSSWAGCSWWPGSSGPAWRPCSRADRPCPPPAGPAARLLLRRQFPQVTAR